METSYNDKEYRDTYRRWRAMKDTPNDEKEKVPLHQRQRRECRKDMQTLIDLLLEINKSEVKRTQRNHPFLKGITFTASVILEDDIDYIENGIRSDDDNLGRIPPRKIQSPKDFFDKNGKKLRFIFLRGEAGSGKSTFCQRLMNYLSKAHGELQGEICSEEVEWVNALKVYDFVFLIPLRNVNNNLETVVEMICHDWSFVNHKTLHDQIREVVTNEKYKCLLILDGLDESNLKTSGLPVFDAMSNNVVLISSRAWKLDEISTLMNDFDRMINIKGLDVEGMRKTFEIISMNKFNKTQEDVDKLFESFRKEYPESFASNPLLLTAAIHLWYENPRTGESNDIKNTSKTYFFLSLVQYLFKMVKSNKGGNRNLTVEPTSSYLKKILKEHKSLHPYVSVLIKLGEIAYEDLVANDTHLVFEESELLGVIDEPNLEFAKQSGLLVTSLADSHFLTKNVRISFIHKNIQELLAALYVVTKPPSTQTIFIDVLRDIYKVFELSYVITFISAFSVKMSDRLSKRISEMASKEIHLYRETFDYEKHSVIRRLYNLQLDCYLEAKMSKMIETQTFKAADVYLRQEDIIENGTYVNLTKDLLEGSFENPISLYLREIPNKSDHGIPDEVLTSFLLKNPNIESINIKGCKNNGRRFESAALFNIVTKGAFILDNVTLPTDALIGFQQNVTQADKLRTLGLWNIKEEPSGAPLALLQFIKTLPSVPNLTSLNICCATNKQDRHILIDVLPKLLNLQNFQYGGDKDNKNKDEIDNVVVKTILKSHAKKLKKLWLNYKVLNEDFLNGLNGFDLIEKVELREVKMEESGWQNAVNTLQKIQHPFDITLVGTDITESARNMVDERDTFEVTFGKSHIHWGEHESFCFKRVVHS